MLKRVPDGETAPILRLSPFSMPAHQVLHELTQSMFKQVIAREDESGDQAI